MIRSLLFKEWRQHWRAFLLMGFLASFGFLTILLSGLVRDEQVNTLEGFRTALAVFGTMMSIILCRSLVVKEYMAQTQLFIETLPITRLAMVNVKFFLGLAILIVLLGLSFGASVVVSGRRLGMDPLFFGITLARASCFLFFCYTFFFATGMLGRYRISIYLALFFVAISLHEFKDFELHRFAPLALLDETFATERHHFPLNALTATMSLALGFWALALVLALVREGSVAALLAEKMSHREKVFFTIGTISLVIAFSIYDTRRKKEPFDFPDASVVSNRGVTIKIATSGQEEERGKQLAQKLNDELVELSHFLAMHSMPTIFITSRRDLDANRFEVGELKESEGLLVRANLSTQNWNDDVFLAWLIREILIVASDGRLKHESRRWVLDGFPLYWVHRKGSPLADNRSLALRASYGAQDGISLETLNSWLRFREKVGDDIACAVAWSGLKLLDRDQGQERCKEFLQNALGKQTPKDIRALFEEWKFPVTHQLQAHAATSTSALITQWNQELNSLRSRFQKELAGIPRMKGHVDFLHLSDSTRQCSYRLEMAPSPEEAPRFSFLHKEISALDEEVPLPEIQHENHSYASTSRKLSATYRSGARFYWTFELQSEVLECRIISGWVRQEIR